MSRKRFPASVSTPSILRSELSASRIREAADKLGMRRLADDGWEKVLKGVTTAEEVLRVTAL